MMSLVLQSIQAREGSRGTWQTVMMLVFCKQAKIKTANVLWPCLSHTHNALRYTAQNYWTVNSKYLN